MTLTFPENHDWRTAYYQNKRGEPLHLVNVRNELILKAHFPTMEKTEENKMMEEEVSQDSLISIGSQSSQAALTLIVFFLLVGVLFLVSRTLRQNVLHKRTELEEESVEVTNLASTKILETKLV